MRGFVNANAKPGAESPRCALKARIVCETISPAIMTSEQRDALIELVNNPPPGSKLAAAKEFGFDLTLLVSSLELTPAERARRLSTSASFFDAVRVVVRKSR